MAYYMIHCCPKRLWYVKEFLIPSMLSQGIDKNHILIYNDVNGIGNLRAFVDSCNVALKFSADNVDGIWHLQDDVIVARDFATDTEALSSDSIVCGFTCAYDKHPKPGFFKVSDREMWFSFPCVYIPTHILKEFTVWANTVLWQSQYFRQWVKLNKADDLVFREWLYNNPLFQDSHILNVAPNLVNHIDDLIGGTVANIQRDPNMNTRSIFWNDNDLIDELQQKLMEVKPCTK